METPFNFTHYSRFIKSRADFPGGSRRPRTQVLELGGGQSIQDRLNLNVDGHAFLRRPCVCSEFDDGLDDPTGLLIFQRLVDVVQVQIGMAHARRDQSNEHFVVLKCAKLEILHMRMQ